MAEVRRILAVLWLAIGAAACGPDAEDRGAPPSLLLVVLDTTRRDAVSAYGAVEGTTPNLEALAAEGLRYDWALAPSPWTLPSHATLFTSLGLEAHGVGVTGRVVLGPGPATLAQQLADAGYQTVGFSENPLLTSSFGLARGFDRFGGEGCGARAPGRERSREWSTPERCASTSWPASRPGRATGTRNAPSSCS